MQVHSTKLTDRILWYDGDSTVAGDSIIEYILSGQFTARTIHVHEITDDIRRYNGLVPAPDRLTTKTDIRPLSFDWQIPDHYKQIDCLEYCLHAITTQIDANPEWTDSDINIRIVRVLTEINYFKQRNLIELLQTLIYVVDVLHANNIVWGVGRGSSVSSYVLYLIGVHDVDSVEYELNVEEFLHIST